MPGLWKAWKAKSRLSPLSTSPLGISPTASEIPTFPQRRRRRRMEKWKTKNRFSTFPPPRFLSPSTNHQNRGRASPRPPGSFATGNQSQSREPLPKCLRPSGPTISPTRSTKGDIARQASFQAHLALESIPGFRFISGLENAPPPCPHFTLPYTGNGPSPGGRGRTRCTLDQPVAVPERTEPFEFFHGRTHRKRAGA
jgi:hypothetical protein